MEGIRRSNHVKMESWRGFLCFKGFKGFKGFKHSLLFPTKCILLKLTSHLSLKAKGNRQGLVNLYKDMESCGEYADIRVMWEMVHSSCPANACPVKRSKRSSYWRFCFRPT
ncbi:hypothetical protein FH972_017132 [Carpinus fangiana]|uniref:Uncharacterized protein n=1 Tax=Carpinus fangiana TaxID=176857 RepID=A0A5N6RII8_9ROSI|nr:hypothetical protein FH972_017132 [Carpinus fangiana]